MSYRDLSDADLADFSKNLAKVLSEHKVPCLDNDLADALATALTPLNTAYETVIENSVVSAAATQAINADKRSQRSVILDRIANANSHISAADGSEADYEICGFSFPKTRSTVVAIDPTDLTAVGTSNGVNSLEFEGNNKSGRVTYEIWRRHGDTADWGMIGTTTTQEYEDKPVTPGQYYEYKVRAKAAKTVSNYSNTAVVYGAP